MMKVFLDCGANLGQGLNEFNKKLSFFNKKDWEIHSFEPNPSIDLSFNKIKNVEVHKKAIWIEDGNLEFLRVARIKKYVSPKGRGAIGIPGELTNVGCRLKHESINKPLQGSTPENLKKEDFVIVPCINFSKFLSKFKGYEKVIVKLDIEGAEYEVLEHLLKNDIVSIIDELYIETHERFVKNQNAQTTKNLLDRVREKGVKVFKWN